MSIRIPRHTLAAAALVVPLLASAQPAAPRAATRADSLSLVDALRMAMALSPSLRVARLAVDGARGDLAIAESAFDGQVVTSAVRDQQSTLGFAPLGDAAASSVASVLAARQQSTSYQISLQQQLPLGMVFTPQLGLSQVGTTGSALAPTNRASAGMSLIVPLAKNRGGTLVNAARREAADDVEASESDLRQSVAQITYQAALAYWDYAAAGERLRVFRSSEARARMLVDETTELVRHDARPAADLQQVRGNLATKRAQRVGAEQALAEARQQLGVVLGIEPNDLAALPEASLVAPLDSAAVAAALRDSTGGRGTVPRVDADVVLARRPDIAAAESRRRAAEIEMGASDNNMRASLDLTVGMSYAGLASGAGVDGFLSPLYRNVRGATMTVQLQYGFPLRNLAARGRAAQATALLEQARTVERDLARQATTATAVAVSGVERGGAALADAAEAVRLARLVVDNEREKFRLGVSTQIDVVLAEDGLMNALLAEIAARRTYAGAVGTLRYQTGELASAGDDVTRLAALLRPVPNAPSVPNAPNSSAPARRDP